MRQRNTANLIGVVVIAALLIAFSGNPPDGHTGAPGESLCSACHSGGSFNGNVAITGLPSTVMAGQTYTITLTATATAGSPVVGGFQIVALNASNQNAGDLIVLNPGETGTETSGGREYMEHRGPKNYAGNSVSWVFDWTAPAGPDNETLTFYFASNMANNNGNSTGDNIINSSHSVQLDAPTPPQVTIDGVNHVTCNGESDGSASAFVQFGTPPFMYDWSNGQSGMTLTNVPAGSYTVTVTDDIGLTGTATVIINQPAPLVPFIAAEEPLTCAMPATVEVDASGGTPGYTFDWSTGDSGPTAMLDLNDLPVTVTVTDDNGCTGELVISSIQVDIDAPLVQVQGGTITCNQPMVMLSAAGSSQGPCFEHEWTGPNNFQSFQFQPTVTVPGVYTLVITNVCNGCTASAEATVTDDVELPVFTLGNPDTLDCHTPLVEMDAGFMSGQSYTWSTVNGHIVYGQDSSIVGVDQPGDYTLVVTRLDNGCTDTALVTVSQISLPAIQVDSLEEVSCFDGQDGAVWLSASGGVGPYTFLWPDSSQAAVRMDLSAGMYVVSVTDTIGCTSADTVIIAQPPALLISLAKSDESAPGADDGSASVSASGGIPAYSYLWSNGSMDTLIQNLAPGTYSVTVTDNNGCEETGSVTIQPFGCNLSASVAEIIHASCHDAEDGSLLIEVIMANGPAEVSWSHGASGLLADSLGAGWYIFSIIDSVGCTYEDSVLLEAPPAIAGTLDSILMPSGPGEKDAAIFVTVDGGVPPYVFAWEDAQGMPVGTDEDLTDVEAGIYTLLVTDDNGCTGSFSFEISPSGVAPSWVNEILLYPVPVADVLRIRLPRTEPLELSLINAQGRTVEEWRSVAGEAVLDMSVLPGGMYGILLRDTFGRGQMFRVVKY